MKLTEEEKYSDLLEPREPGIIFAPYIPNIFSTPSKNDTQINYTLNLKSKSRYKFIKNLTKKKKK